MPPQIRENMIRMRDRFRQSKNPPVTDGPAKPDSKPPGNRVPDGALLYFGNSDLYSQDIDSIMVPNGRPIYALFVSGFLWVEKCQGKKAVDLGPAQGKFSVHRFSPVSQSD